MMKKNQDIKVIGYFLKGNSFPIVVQQGKTKYLVKPRAGLCGPYAMASEWLGHWIGRHIGINTREPFWTTLTGDIDLGDIYIEIRDLIQKSMGVNIGFAYLEHVRDTTSNDEVKDKELWTDLFLLDVLMWNIDRSPSNFQMRMQKGWFLVERLHRIEEAALETTEERDQRISENRKRLESRFRDLH
jgi:hypothetical protein